MNPGMPPKSSVPGLGANTKRSSAGGAGGAKNTRSKAGAHPSGPAEVGLGDFGTLAGCELQVVRGSCERVGGPRSARPCRGAATGRVLFLVGRFHHAPRPAPSSWAHPPLAHPRPHTHPNPPPLPPTQSAPPLKAPPPPPRPSAPCACSTSTPASGRARARPGASGGSGRTGWAWPRPGRCWPGWRCRG